MHGTHSFKMNCHYYADEFLQSVKPAGCGCSTEELWFNFRQTRDTFRYSSTCVSAPEPIQFPG